MQYLFAFLLVLALGWSPAYAQQDATEPEQGAPGIEQGEAEEPAGGDLEKAVAERLNEAAAVVGAMQGIPPEQLERAECIAVIPAVKEGALLIGYQYGRGVMTCHADPDAGVQGLGGLDEPDRSRTWLAPSMIALDSASVGLQAGGTSTDFVVLFMTSDSIQPMLEGDIEFGVDVQATAGRTSDEPAEPREDPAQEGDVVTYGRSDGLFAGISLEGASMRPDEDANEGLYGRGVDAGALLGGSEAQAVPAAAESFMTAIESVTGNSEPGALER